MERRLAAVLVADIVGYSRLMNEDEEGTLRAVKDTFSSLIDPKVAQYHGRIIKLTGDGALMEFGSAVDAVTFAVEVQCAMRERNRDVPDVRRIVYRIGINIGDIIIEPDDIYGDGVNIAARLEGLADPGTICVAGNVFDQVRGKLDLTFEPLGERRVKNIPEPISAYGLVLDDKAEGLVTAIQPTASRKRPRTYALAAGVALIIVAMFFGWWRPWKADVEPAVLERMAFALPDKPSIAVLPFDNLTGDADLKHIADGMTETLTSTLSRIPKLFVIARNSASVYGGKAVKVQQVAEELGVRYVLEGSVQQAGKRLRVTVQLIDALKGHHLWTESFDQQLSDLFKLQDEIALRTTIELQVKLTVGDEARMLSRTTNSVRAWTLYQQGLSNFFRFSAKGNREARRFAERALAEDARFADAMIIIGFTHLSDARSGYTPSSLESLRLALKYANDARSVAPHAPNLYNLMQAIYRYRGEFDKAIAAGERAIELSPNSEISLLATTMTTHLAGEFNRSVALAEKAVRQSPHHRSIGLIWLGRSLWFNREYSKTIDAAKEGLERAESQFIASAHLLNLAAAYVATDDIKKARRAMSDALQKAPKLSLSFLKSFAPYKSNSDWQRFASALRSAGLPD